MFVDCLIESCELNNEEMLKENVPELEFCGHRYKAEFSPPAWIYEYFNPICLDRIKSITNYQSIIMVIEVNVLKEKILFWYLNDYYTRIRSPSFGMEGFIEDNSCADFEDRVFLCHITAEYIHELLKTIHREQIELKFQLKKLVNLKQQCGKKVVLKVLPDKELRFIQNMDDEEQVVLKEIKDRVCYEL